MNIKILDSWLRDYLQTKATPKEIGKALSLTSVSVEKIEKFKNDLTYDIEITTNRPDLMSVIGLAKEAAAILPQFEIEAKFKPPKLQQAVKQTGNLPLKVLSDKNLVNRVLSVVMEVDVKQSPKYISERLESTDIRSLNNVIDITNYVMRTIGHPTHVFDYDRLQSELIKIRKSQKGEFITTLDEKTYELPGNDIVAVNQQNEIVDLLGVIGLRNSVVTSETKRIVYFINNNIPNYIRKTSMSLGIRTEAAQLNEKQLDPELAYEAFLFGIKLYEELADGKIVSNIIDIYPNKNEQKTVSITESKIQSVIGVPLSLKEANGILLSLGFTTEISQDTITATVPSSRLGDISIPEDLIEEIARVYGYHNIPSKLPPHTASSVTNLEESENYWEERIKNAFKYWGFTETYTYPFVSKQMYQGSLENAVKLANPLGEEFVYMRKTLVPSLLQVVSDNGKFEKIAIFEIANVYEKNKDKLPQEVRKLAGVVKQPKVSFYNIKGVIEQLFLDLGIKHAHFKPLKEGGLGADVFIESLPIGMVEVLEKNLINFELDLSAILKHATTKKTYTPVSKFPGIIEDLNFILANNVITGDVLDLIKKQSDLIKEVTFLDRYNDSRTFHLVYGSNARNLTNQEVAKIREKVIKAAKDKFGAKLKS